MITKDIFKKLLYECPVAPPEVGGILGGVDGIIQTYVMDFPEDSSANNRYMPNIKKLNQKIAEWLDKDIEFYGVFHTHYPYGYALSIEDKQYIVRIMEAMPARIIHLYFPILIPSDGMAAFKAVRDKGVIRIEADTMKFV